MRDLPFNPYPDESAKAPDVCTPDHFATFRRHTESHTFCPASHAKSFLRNNVSPRTILLLPAFDPDFPRRLNIPSCDLLVFVGVSADSYSDFCAAIDKMPYNPINDVYITGANKSAIKHPDYINNIAPIAYFATPSNSRWLPWIAPSEDSPVAPALASDDFKYERKFRVSRFQFLYEIFIPSVILCPIMTPFPCCV